jgi:hypothetical protein
LAAKKGEHVAREQVLAAGDVRCVKVDPDQE